MSTPVAAMSAHAAGAMHRRREKGDALATAPTTDAASTPPHATSAGSANAADDPESSPATYENTAHVMSGTHYG